MRLISIYIKNILPVKLFNVDDLSDVIVIAGPNGVGKTRLIQGLLQYFQQPRPNSNIRLVLEATCEDERNDWGKNRIDTNLPEDCQKLVQTLQKGRRRRNWKSSVLNFESDRTIQQINPFQFSWDNLDPWEESVGWSMTFGGLRARFQDTLHSIFRKVASQREQIARKAEELMKQGEKQMDLDFPDPLEPFKHAFSQLLAPKKLLDAEPKRQQLDYIYDGRHFSIDSLSSGEREVVNIAFDFILRNPSDCIVFFDEPELHLHPELSYKLLQTLRSIGSNNQFILSTHSPDIITASLDNSVIFIAASTEQENNQAIVVKEDDETNQALKSLGQSIGIIALGKKIVLIEGSSTSLDKQVYGMIIKDRFPNLVLVPSGGKTAITSFSTLADNVLERTIWGVEFFMLCDRDALSPSSLKELKQTNNGRLRVLGRHHLENYFMDEDIWAKVFSCMEPDGSLLRSPTEIKNKFKEIASEMISYAAALTVSSCFREQVGKLDIMPKDCYGKNEEQLIELLSKKSSVEKVRINGILDSEKVVIAIREAVSLLNKSLTEDSDDWKSLIPGKQLLNIFASKVKMNVGRLKLLYLKESEKQEYNPFDEIVKIFSEFNSY
ncbi:MAG: AAA family ATPase [Nitrospirota bacterium]